MTRPSSNHVHRLLATPFVEAVRRALGETSGVWIVGGAVRDPDLAVAGEPRPLARAIAAELGDHAFELSAEFHTWRVVSRRHGWQVDLTALRGESIEADLHERDFTIGAVAVPLGDGEAIDPFSGLHDLDARVLRAVSD